MDATPYNVVTRQPSCTQQFGNTVSVSQAPRQYGNTYVSGSGLTILGNVETLVQPRPEPDSIDQFGLCLGSAPRIDAACFVGRVVEMNVMSQCLQPETTGGRQRRVLLGGIGGIGKTQLALAYAEHHHHCYDSVFWLNATSQTTLQTDFRLLAGRLLPVQELDVLTDEQMLRHVHEWLSNTRNTRWLLVFDNYDEPSQFDIRPYCPYSAHGSIIVTTRLPDRVRLSGDHVRVQPLSDLNESLDILQKRSRRHNVKDDLGARRLAERLAGLPLALATAGAYLSRRASVTFQQYLDVYEQRWNVDPRRLLLLHEYQDRTLFTTWDVSYALLIREDPDAAQMLRLLAYYDNQSIWYELLCAGTVDDLPSWLQQALHDRVDFESVMSTLVDYCFVEVQVTTQSYSLHNCIHDWTLATLNETLDRQLYWYAFDCVAASIDEYDYALWAYLRCAHLVPHARRLTLSWFVRDLLLHTVEDDRLNSAEIIALFLDEQVQYVAAEQLYLRVLVGREKALGPDHTSTLDTVHNLGTLYIGQGKLSEAEQMYIQALAGKEKALGPNHTLTLDTRHGLANLYCKQDKLAQAESIYQQLLIGYETALGNDHPSTMLLFRNFGRMYERQDRREEAESMYQRALIGYEKRLGQEHPQTCAVRYDLAELRRQPGNMDIASSILNASEQRQG